MNVTLYVRKEDEQRWRTLRDRFPGGRIRNLMGYLLDLYERQGDNFDSIT